MKIETTDFNPITSLPVGMGAERIQYEEVLAFILNKLIADGKDLDQPVKLVYKHPEMVKKGYLEETEDGYCLTLKSIGILHAYCGKDIKAIQ